MALDHIDYTCPLLSGSVDVLCKIKSGIKTHVLDCTLSQHDSLVALVEDHIKDVVEHVSSSIDAKAGGTEELDKVRQRHHEVMEHIGSDIDAGYNFLVYQSLLQLVRRLTRRFDGKLFDLGQLGRELLAAHHGCHGCRCRRIVGAKETGCRGQAVQLAEGTRVQSLTEELLEVVIGKKLSVKATRRHGCGSGCGCSRSSRIGR